jgi:hypothetical protein
MYSIIFNHLDKILVEINKQGPGGNVFLPKIYELIELNNKFLFGRAKKEDYYIFIDKVVQLKKNMKNSNLRRVQYIFLKENWRILIRCLHWILP